MKWNFWYVLARTGAYWRVLARTGVYWRVLGRGPRANNEDFRTFSKSADEGEGEEKSNEEALWLRQERLK